MNSKFESYVIFELAGSLYGIPSQNVRHIEMFEQVTLVPNANPAIDGVVFSRGQVIPALNLRVRFGFPRADNTLRTRIIFAAVHQRTVGLIVDTAREFQNVPVDAIGPIEETLTGINGKYLKAVTKVNERLVLILDLEAVLNVEDVQLPPEAEKTSSEQLTSK
ncbi:MAG TPA: chemotaxis protein CheW [Verrucomicrobiae bacterium]|jgi:purine-binding chemotaxis protein CheW|nr:chemotaxis protein CheW [Verrucomicrobiae bacterium]